MCGVFGIRSPGRDVARIAYFGLFALQHRGQESAGIAVSDEGRLTVLRDMGLISQVFDEQKLSGLHGDVAIGHTRYSTTGVGGMGRPSVSLYSETLPETTGIPSASAACEMPSIARASS